MKEEEDVSSERRHELLPLSIHQQRVIVWFVLKRNFVFFFPKNNFSSFLKNVSIFFFSIHYTCEKEPLLLCERLEEQQQHGSKKESTSEKSGEREDGFEGRERRTFGVVFEDSC